MKKIPLTKGKFAIVDDEDYPYLSRFDWYANKKKDIEYAITGIYMNKVTTQIPLHYFLTKRRQGYVIVHKNRNCLDNRKSNLLMVRACISHHRTKKYKMRSDNRTGIRSKYKGLCWDKRNKKWQVSIMKDKKRTYVGIFKEEKKGAEAYNKKAKELYGKFAYQNKI